MKDLQEVIKFRSHKIRELNGYAASYQYFTGYVYRELGLNDGSHCHQSEGNEIFMSF